MTDRDRILRWAVVGVGVGLIAVTLANLLTKDAPFLIALVQRALPVALGVVVVIFGLWLQHRGLPARYIGGVAAGHVAGAVLFALFVYWLVFLVGIQFGPVTVDVDFLYLNAAAIGAVTTGALTAGYLSVQRQQERLERRTAELRRQNERLDQFASILSHDLRNPLNVASGSLELARETGAAADFETIERAHERMETLIEDVLALARHGRTVADPEPLPLGDVAEAAWATVATGEASLVVERSTRVRADRSRLQQAFENLFRNAVEHGGDDLTTVRVGGLPGGGFYVEDDGAGIPADARGRVGETGYSTSTDGTGHGLAIVRAIAEAHGWTISVTDGTDGGARFEVG